MRIVTLFVLLCSLALVGCSTAHAQDVPVPADVVDEAPASAPSVVPAVATAVPNIDADPVGYARAAYSAAKGGQWLALVALLIVGLVYVVRRWGAKLLPWLGTDRGGVASALVCGVLVSLAASALSGSLGVGSIVGAFEQAVIAVGGFTVLKKLIFPSDAKA